MQLVYGLRLKGAGHLGVKGDTYDLATAYSYPATRLVESLSPSSFWRSSADNTDVNVVFACGVADIFEADTVAIFGTNFRTATLQAHSSDSWGALPFMAWMQPSRRSQAFQPECGAESASMHPS
jgi:hypothetical protein